MALTNCSGLQQGKNDILVKEAAQLRDAARRAPRVRNEICFSNEPGKLKPLPVLMIGWPRSVSGRRVRRPPQRI
jgi:hypothetical protein